MEHLYLTVIFLFTLFFLLGSGVWIGLALIGVAYVGMEIFTVRPAGDAMITTIWTTSSSWSLTALPLFIWMGEILYRTKLSEDLFKGLPVDWLAVLVTSGITIALTAGLVLTIAKRLTSEKVVMSLS
jgi:TRAP-type mannitol/chloroaromatic compound transport system permease large subunit